MENGTITSEGLTVVKVGGARLASATDLDLLADRIESLRRDGRRVVVVHGGGPEISDLHDRLGIPFEKVNGLRATSEEGMQATAMVLCGAVRTRIVERLTARGIDALGVSGVDLGLMRAPFVDETALGRVGGPPTIDVEAFGRLLATGAVLIVSPVSIGPDGGAVNVNADDAAHAVATALDARSLDFVSDVPGVRTARDRIARRLDPGTVADLVTSGVVRGGMVPKLTAAVAAVRAGVGRVRIGDLASMADGRATVITAKESAS